MKLLVLMIARGRALYTKQTFDSLKATCPEGTVFSVWHNGQPENGMLELLQEFHQWEVSLEDLGWGKGHNLHIAKNYLKDYDYVLLTDNDIEYKPGWFDTCTGLLEKYPNIGVLAVWKHIHHGLLGTQYPDLVCKDQMPGCGWIFKSSRLQELLPIPENGSYKTKGGVGEDVTFCNLARQKGYLIAAPVEDVARHIDGY